MKKIIKHTILAMILVFVLVLPFLVFADSPTKLLQDTAGSEGAGYNVSAEGDETLFANIIGTVVRIFLSILGIIFVGLMIYGGYNWMIARGDEQKVTIAKQTIQRAIIGLIIIISSYAFYAIIINAIALN